MAEAFDGTKAKIDELFADAKADILESIEHDYAWSLSRCESPIERLYAAQILHPMIAREFSTHIELLHPQSGLYEHCAAPPMPGVYMWQQIKIGPYRVDFLFDAVGGYDLPKLIVEIDGHEFHERTKEQAKRDKSRDRYLVGRGFRILRFTGSEIFNEPFDAAYDTLAILTGVAS